MKVTRILHSDHLNAGKYSALQEQASLLGEIRSEVWEKFGGMSGLSLKDRQVRDAWMAEGRTFPVPANAWKETLRDAMGDIKATREAAKEKVKKAIRERTSDKKELKRLYGLLKRDEWLKDPFLHRQMRKHFKHGKNKTFNQIIVRADKCKPFELNGQCWLKVPSLVRGKPISIPLKTTMEHAPSGTLRLILAHGRVEVHYQKEVELEQTCGSAKVGVDKGYTEALVDSDGDVYGEGLGKLISKESDYLNQKYQRRNKIRAVAEKKAQKKPHKAAAIEQHNLGRKKLDKRQERQVQQLRTLIFTGVHGLINKAGVVVCEDLSSPFASKRRYGKQSNRRLNTWTKGIIADALETVSQRRGSSLRLVNAAYTSQADSQCHGLLMGRRDGDRFYRENGEVVQADHNAAGNVLLRDEDPEITFFMPHKQVKAVLVKRTESYRSKLIDQDSSYTPPL